jgi:uncharacterized membrane protein YagU involved in acid resistance
VAGLAGGFAGALAMNMYARAMGDPRGHGMQPPQAEGDDSAAEAGAMVYRQATDHEPSRSEKQTMGTAAHYAFGMAAGVCYAVLSERMPAIRNGYGTAYGAFVWALADEGTVPALGLSKSPHQLPARTQGYALSGHAVFGAALEAVMRLTRH